MPVTLLGAGEIRALAAELDVTPTKKLGQNFVVDANSVRKIVHVARVEAGEHVVEVGPGLGSLTLAILEAGASVTAVEIDHRLAERLPATAAKHGVDDGALTVIDADALRITELPGDPTVLVANLPYNVSVPVLLHFLETFPHLQRGVVMVQAEVGERLAAPPGSKIYGAPSVKAAWYGPWRLAGTVSRQVFWPVPNVDSVLVAFERDPRPARHRGGATAHLPDRGCRVPAASQDAPAGAVRGAGRHVGRGIRHSRACRRRPHRPRRGALDRGFRAHRAHPGVTQGYSVPGLFSGCSRNMPVTFGGLGHRGVSSIITSTRGTSACVRPNMRRRSACCCT